jgi:uroporphyrinogen decarboxylase
MTARERLQAVLQHKEPDRIPVDIGATPYSGIAAMAYNRLKSRLGMSHAKAQVVDVMQQLARPDNEFLDRFHIDVVSTTDALLRQDSDWYEVSLSDGSLARYPHWFHPVKTVQGGYSVRSHHGAELAEMPSGKFFFEPCYFPYRDGYPADFKKLSQTLALTPNTLLSPHPWKEEAAPSSWLQYRQKMIELSQESDRGQVIVYDCSLLNAGAALRQMQKFLMDLVLDANQVEHLLDALLEIHLHKLEQICQSVGDVADVICFCDDLGDETGPHLTPELYRKFFKSRYLVLTDFIKQHSKLAVMLQTSGAVYDLMQDIIESGFEILSPVQTFCRNMEPERLQQQFGNDLCFWGGGCDTRSVLNRASVRQVREHVQKRLEIFAQNGRYVFAPVSSIPAEAPAENILAMFKTIDEFTK